MDPTIIVALINAAAMIAVALVVNHVRRDVKTVRREMNGMKDALIAGAGREGVTEGRRLQKDETDSK